ncbi:enoyl-CoA delta isomerase 2, mitochondrial-like [Mizuhopecten yessoensis]|uniref:Enoyl-CoA delta isomerase 2, mitochondrial n=1 Tax=Mizuhopecten yessoensis TaxID=6573 RepID=A0A210PE66_MIZYE|nr:enoyl-CoA delta isomerase 2, mitochondrial-like [Mizuhopecten yessoensis]OWF34767.1 Enoyl-CoA delta isomerase 2, mitochondrial [Mizuhopecten yessoensis]
MAASILRRCLTTGICQRLAATATRGIHRTVPAMAVIDDKFSQAKDRLNTFKEDPGNATKLQMYALFKQATIGKCNAPKPGMMDFVGKAKWDAWNGLAEMTQDQAKQKYVDIVDELAGKETPASSPPSGEKAPASKFETIDVTNTDGVCKIMLNRPEKKNALNFQMYEEIGNALNEAGQDDSVVLAVLTGAGDYYCSGNDLGNFMNIPPDGVAKMAEEGGVILEKFVRSFIDFPKPLISLINGPAVGVSVTVLGLFDAVYATDKATFHTPFTSLGQSPEGCSSYTFPRLMGTAKASELLLFNRKITAVEAMERNLVTEVFPDHAFKQEATARVEKFAKLPKNSLQKSRNLTRDQLRETLHRVNKQECDVLVERWQSEECLMAIMNFFTAKGSKL